MDPHSDVCLSFDHGQNLLVESLCYILGDNSSAELKLKAELKKVDLKKLELNQTRLSSLKIIKCVHIS